MALAETARLVVALDLKNGLRQGAAEAVGQVTGIERASARAAAPMSRLTTVTQGAGRAMDHFRGRVRGATQVLGGVGLLAGVTALTSYAKNAVDSAEAWADATRRIHAVSGMGIQEASRFADTFDKLGVGAEKQVRILGFMSKTLGSLSMNQKAAKKVQEDYGFSLLDSRGRMRSNMDVLMEFTEYFNDKTIPAQQKAALGTKLFGRGWTDLIPVLEQGPKRVRDAMSGAMTMTDAQMRTMNRWRTEQRELNDAMGDLSVKVGMVIVPALTDLAKGVTKFVSENEQDVLRFFEGLVRGGRDLASLLTGTVIPTLSNLGTGAANLWNSIPGPLRDLLVKGFVADRTIKFLFGFSMTDVLKGGLKGLLGGGLFQRGSSPATPMYVKPVGVGLGGGAAGVPGGGGVGRLAKVGVALEGVAIVGAVAATIDQFAQDRSAEQAQLAEQAAGLLGDVREKSLADITNMTRLLKESQGADRVAIQTFASKELGDALRNVTSNLVEEMNNSERGETIEKLIAAQEQALAYGWKEVADDIGAKIRKVQEGGGGESSTDNLAGQQRRTNKLMVEMAGVARATRDAARRAERTNDRGLKRAAELISKGVMGDKDNAQAVRQAIRILEREQKQATERGANKMARNIGRDIAVLRRAVGAQLGKQSQKLGTIANKPPPSVTVTTNVTAQVGIRDVERATSTVSRYGRATAV